MMIIDQRRFALEYRHRLVNERALAVLPSLLPDLLPDGVFEGVEYNVRNPTRNDRRIGSFKINASTGAWCEFASGHEAKGGDPLSLVSYVKEYATADEAVCFLTEALKNHPLTKAQRTFRPRPRGEPVVPIPFEMPEVLEHDDFRTFVCGLVPDHEPTDAFAYHDANGRLIYLSIRFRNTLTGTKTFRPVSYVEWSDRSRGWSSLRPPMQLPPYNLLELQKRQTSPVLVVEGEGTADAAAAHFADHVVVTSANGANGARQTDWSSFAGRVVTIWPDNDEAGKRYAADVVELAREAGAVSFRVVSLPPTLPNGWDLKDEVPEGLDTRSILASASEQRKYGADATEQTEQRANDMGAPSNVQTTDFSVPCKSRDARPVIRLIADQLKATADKSEDALIDSDRGLYQRGGLIVSVDKANVITADAKNVVAQHIIERGDYALLEDLSVTARFEKYDKRSKNWSTSSPPMEIVKLLKQRHGRLRLPILSGVINAPTLRSDGTILDVPGYDPATGLLFDPRDTVFLNVKGRPSKADAEGALGELRNLIVTFPFAGEADRSVALAAIVTSVVRHSLPTAPLFGFAAPVPGSGKSMLVDIASVIATGRKAGVLAQGKTDEETEKRLASVLLAGDGIIAVDNCEQSLGGDLLCQMLTQSMVRIRILGKSETVELPTGALVTATGNNLTLVGDMTRRALICKLDPRVERPELRSFKNNPVEDASAQRGLLVTAILTILRAYIVAGKPRQVNPLGSFEAWSDLVRGALIWLDCADPVDTMEQARMGDPHTIARQTVMAQWRRVIRWKVSVGNAIKAADEHDDFRDALLLVAGVSDKINNVRLGKWLGKNKDIIVTVTEQDSAASVQCCFRQDGIIDGNKMWYLQES